MAKMPRKLNAQETILHNELVYMDQVIEPNLQDGPANRVIPWSFINRTIYSFSEEHHKLRGFPDGSK
jgi:hypothetical protein